MSYRFNQLRSVQRTRQESSPPPRRARRRPTGRAGAGGGLDHLTNKFEAPEVREERKRREDQEVREFLEKEKQRQAAAAEAKRVLEEEKRRLEKERLQREAEEEAERCRAEEQRLRIEESRRKMEEEEAELAKLKPAQARFHRLNKKAHKENDNGLKGTVSNSGGVRDAKEKLIKNQKRRDENFGKELDIIVADSSQGKKNKRGRPPSTPSRVRKSRTTPSSLPNMFEQQQRREQEFMRSKLAGRAHVPMDRKVLSHVMNRFEDEASRAKAKEQMNELTSKNKDWSIQDRREEKEQRRREEQWRLKKEEDDRLRRKRREERETKRLEQEQQRKNMGKNGKVLVVKTENTSEKTTESDNSNLLKLKNPTEEQPRQPGNKGKETGNSTKASAASMSVKNQDNGMSCTVAQHPTESDGKSQVTDTSSSSGNGRQALFVRKCDGGGGEKKDTTFGKRKHKELTKKEEMQDYLLSHLLFEEVTEESQERFGPEEKLLLDPVVDNDVPLLDPDYVEEMEKLLALVENKTNKQKRSRKKKKAKPSVPKLKIFDMGNIKTKFELSKQNHLNKSSVSRSVSREFEVPPLFEENKSKVMGLFEGGVQTSKHPQNAGAPKSINADLIKKFDCPETAARLKKQKETEKEERKLKAQREAERHRRLEEEHRLKEQEKQMRLQEEEELRRKLLQEEENKRQQEEKEKRLQLEKEAEAKRQNNALDTDRARKDDKTRLEIKDPKHRSNKVLARFQHVFDAPATGDDDNSKETVKEVGHINADDLFAEMYAQSTDKKPLSFQDSSLTGVSLMMHKAKRKLEATDRTEKPTLMKRAGEKRRQLNVAAVGFELKKQLLDNENTISSWSKVETQQDKEWTFKKRSPVDEVAIQNDSVKPKREDTQREHTISGCAKEDKDVNGEGKKVLLEDLQEISSRMLKRNTQEEQERKMEDHAKFLAEMQEYLNEPAVLPPNNPFSHFVEVENEKGKKTKAKKSKTSIAPLRLTSVDQIKSQLIHSEKDDSAKRDNEPSKQSLQKGNNYVKGLQQQLWGADECDDPDNFKKIPLASSKSEGRLVDLVGKALLRKQVQDCPAIHASKTKVPKKIVSMPENTTAETTVSKQCDWKYKRKSTQVLQTDISHAAPKPLSSQENQKIEIKGNEEIELGIDVKSNDSGQEENKGFNENIKEISLRLLKRNAEEQDKKMKEHAKFMKEIQEILNEPITSKDNPFLCLIEDDKKVTSDKNEKLKTVVAPIALTSVGKIKSQFIQPGKNDGEFKDESPQHSSSERRNNYVKGLQQQLWGTDDSDLEKKPLASSKSEGQLVKFVGKVLLKKQVLESGLNPVPRSKVPKKLIPMPENTSIAETAMANAVMPRQSDWKYKKKVVPQMQVDFDQSELESSHNSQDNDPDCIDNNKCEPNVVETILEEQATQPEEKNDTRTADYNKLMDELDDFLTSPRRYNESEVHYKEEIGRFLALIEDKPKKKTKKGHPKKSPPKKLQKLRSNLLEAWEATQQNEKEPCNISSTENKYVYKLKDKLEQELSGKSTTKKEEIRVTTVGASVIKKSYERMNKDIEVPLLGPRTCRLKGGVEEVIAEDGVKTLDEIKAERDQKQWKWKEKQLEELHAAIGARKSMMYVEEKDKMTEEFEDEASRKDEGEAINVPSIKIKEIGEIERDRQRKDMEFEEFLAEIKEFLASDRDDQEADYLAMLDEEEERQRQEWEIEEKRRKNLTQQDCTSETRRPRVLLRTGRELASKMEKLERSGSGSRTTVKVVRKLDPNLLEKTINMQYEDDGRRRNISPKRPVGSLGKHLWKPIEEESKDPAPSREKVPKKVIDVSMFDKNFTTSSNTLHKTTDEDKKIWKWKQKKIDGIMERKAFVADEAWACETKHNSDRQSVQILQVNRRNAGSKEDKFDDGKLINSDGGKVNKSDNLHLKQLSKETTKVALLRDAIQKGKSETSTSTCNPWTVDNTRNIDLNLLKTFEGKRDESKSTPKICITQFSDDSLPKSKGKPLATKERPVSDSFSALKNIMNLARDSEVSRAFAASKKYFEKPAAGSITPMSEDEKLKMDCRRRSVVTLREKLMGKEEKTGTMQTVLIARPTRSKSCANMRRQFESLGEPQSSIGIVEERKISDNGNRRDGVRSRSLTRSKSTREGRPTKMSMIRQSNHSLDVSDACVEWRSSSQGRAGHLVRNRSFSKFREAFETGDVSKLRDEEGDADTVVQHQNMGVKAELQALKHCPRLQNLLRINRPQECPPKRSPATRRRRGQSGLDLDEETMEEVAKSRAAIKNMLESTTAPKITFGANLRKVESSDCLGGPRKSVPRNVDPSFTERKWVFDTINKYFDVIKEEKEEDTTVGAEQAGSKSNSVQPWNDGHKKSNPDFSQLRSSDAEVLRLTKDFSNEERGQDEIEVNRFKLSQSKSSGRLRDMVTSIISRSGSTASLNAFKSNLGSHLQLRRQNSVSRESSVANSPRLSRASVCNSQLDINDSDWSEEDNQSLHGYVLS